MDKKDFIREFIDSARTEYGKVPKFIHTMGAQSVNYSGPYFDDSELTSIIDSVMFGDWLSAGSAVHQFEQEFSHKFLTGYSLMVNSGSSANLLMIAALKKRFGWADGAEVILSVVGFPTTLSALLVNKLKPVFIDIEFDTLNFDTKLIWDKVTDETVAIFISPVLGNSPDFNELMVLHGEFGIELILDNCDSLGSMWQGKYLSEYCVASSCSFYPAHHIATGEGGMVSSKDREVMKIARSMASWGRDCTCVGTDNLLSKGSCGTRFREWLPEQDIIIDHKYVFSNLGYNLKPLDLQGAIGLVQLSKFDDIKRKRIGNKNTIALIVTSILHDVKAIKEIDGAETSWFGTPFICPTKEYKVRLVAFLEQNKIQTRNYFAGNILLHPAYSDLDDWHDYPEANKVLERVFFLGCSPNYNEDTFEYIESTLKKFTP